MRAMCPKWVHVQVGPCPRRVHVQAGACLRRCMSSRAHVLGEWAVIPFIAVPKGWGLLLAQKPHRLPVLTFHASGG